MSGVPGAEAVEHTADKAGKVLGHKIGPLPAGAWLVAIGGGLAVAYYINRTGAADEADPATVDYADEAEATGWEQGGDTSTPPGVGNTSGNLGSGYPTPPNPAALKSNNAWRMAAVTALVSAGRSSWRSQLATSLYLKGRRLSDGQQALIGEAISLVGPTPSPVPLPKRAKPKPKPKPHQGGHSGPQSGSGHGGGPKGHDRPKTNGEWRTAAHRWLVGRGRNAEAVHGALADYFGSRKLSDAERTMIRNAHTHLGQPPNPPPPAPTGHKPATHHKPGGTRRDDGRGR